MRTKGGLEMHKLVINNNNLQNNDICPGMVRNKARALIFNENGEILVARYSGVYLFPGGKIEKDENPLDTIYREVMEEAGIDLKTETIRRLITIQDYQHQYPDRFCECIKRNRVLNTTYYVANTTQNFIPNNHLLTANEKNNAFTLMWIKPAKLLTASAENKVVHPTNSFFQIELASILNFYYNEKALYNTEDDKILDQDIDFGMLGTLVKYPQEPVYKKCLCKETCCK